MSEKVDRERSAYWYATRGFPGRLQRTSRCVPSPFQEIALAGARMARSEQPNLPGERLKRNAMRAPRVRTIIYQHSLVNHPKVVIYVKFGCARHRSPLRLGLSRSRKKPTRGDCPRASNDEVAAQRSSAPSILLPL